MARTFAYCRVSTLGQTVENQVREIEAAGFRVEKRRLVTETVSGSSAIEQRPGFLKLLDRLERDDVLVVTKLDRLGRNSIDVQTTVRRKPVLDGEQQQKALQRLADGASISAVAREMKASRATIMRVGRAGSAAPR
jgi:DNA invertase Pin-like site-specific DNA recombinase